jgi:cell division protein FtsB
MLIWILGIMVAVVLLLLVMSYSSNKKLKEEIDLLHEIIKVKEQTIENYQASRVAVKDVIENLSDHEEVMAMVKAGESNATIAEKLGIPENKIELIIKFDKIKKDHAAS